MVHRKLEYRSLRRAAASVLHDNKEIDTSTPSLQQSDQMMISDLLPFKYNPRIVGLTEGGFCFYSV